MIIVEGPDGSGKTTLIEYLADRLEVPVAPRVVSKDTEAMVDLQEWVAEDVKKGPEPIIYDRYRLFSEAVYGPILRDTAQPGFDQIMWFGYHFQTLIGNRQPLILYCLPPLEVVLANLDGDDDNKAVVDKARAIYSAYVAQAAMVHVLYPRTLLHDFTSGGSTEQVEFFAAQYLLSLNSEADNVE